MKKRTAGPIERAETRLAFWLLFPTFLMVMAVVLFPLLANFWVSFKPVMLADLRAPTPVANEQLRGDKDVLGGEVKLIYRLRNSSQNEEIKAITMADVIPPGIAITGTDERCTIVEQELFCNLGDFPAKHREDLELTATIEQAYLDNPINPRDSKPEFTGKANNILTDFSFTLENYALFLGSDEIFTLLKTSLYYSVFGTLGAIIFGLFAAQILFVAFPGRFLFRGIFLFPYVAPVIAVAFSWLVLFDPFSGTLNQFLISMGITSEAINFFGQRYTDISIFGFTFEFPLALFMVIAFESWRYFPLSFLFILARMQSLSSDLYEAAEMDGATPLQQFYYISLPQLAGIIGTLFLLRFIWTFNKFDDIFLLTGGAAGTRVFTVEVYEKGFAVSNLGAGAAIAVFIFIFLLTFSFIAFRFTKEK